METTKDPLARFTISNNWDVTPETKGKSNSKFVLKEVGKRSSLSEGRNWGFATALAFRKGKELITTHALTACKDFESDVIWSQLTKKPYSIYGLNSEFIPDFFDNGKGYLIFGIEKKSNGSTYTNFKRDYDILQSNYKNLEKFINWFEKKFKTKTLTKIQKLGENRFVAVYPNFWGEGTYLISLYCLLLRVGFFYKNEEPISYLKNFKYASDDTYLLNSVMGKIEKMLDNKIPKQDIKNCHSPHSTGILGYNF